MEQQTQKIFEETFGPEFKQQIDLKDRVIKSLNTEEANAKKRISDLEQEILVLTQKKENIQEEIMSAYAQKESDFKKSQDDFENTKKSTSLSFEQREKDFDSKVFNHESNLKAYQDNVQSLNKERSEFENKKKSIADTLEEAGNAHNDLFKDAVLALKKDE